MSPSWSSNSSIFWMLATAFAIGIDVSSPRVRVAEADRIIAICNIPDKPACFGFHTDGYPAFRSGRAHLWADRDACMKHSRRISRNVSSLTSDAFLGVSLERPSCRSRRSCRNTQQLVCSRLDLVSPVRAAEAPGKTAMAGRRQGQHRPRPAVPSPASRPLRCVSSGTQFLDE